MSTGANAILLDTSVVVRHFRGMGGVTGKLNEVDRLVLPMVALAELYAGAFRFS